MTIHIYNTVTLSDSEVSLNGTKCKEILRAKALTNDSYFRLILWYILCSNLILFYQQGALQMISSWKEFIWILNNPFFLNMYLILSLCRFGETQQIWGMMSCTHPTDYKNRYNYLKLVSNRHHSKHKPDSHNTESQMTLSLEQYHKL